MQDIRSQTGTTSTMSRGLLLPTNLVYKRHRAVCEAQLEAPDISDNEVDDCSQDMSGLTSMDCLQNNSIAGQEAFN